MHKPTNYDDLKATACYIYGEVQPIHWRIVPHVRLKYLTEILGN